MKVFNWEDYYDKKHCPRCGRLRLISDMENFEVRR